MNVTCPECAGRKEANAFVRYSDGCVAERVKCRFCKGAGTVAEYDNHLWHAGKTVTHARQANDLSLREAANLLGCRPFELSDIEHGRAPAHHDIIIKRLSSVHNGLKP